MNKINDLEIEKIFKYAINSYQNKDYLTAKNFYNEILDKEPNHIGALNNIATVFSDLNDIPSAIICYKKIIKIEPSFFNAYYNLGNILFSMKDFIKAKDYYKKATNINPNSVDAQFNLGVAYKKLEDNAKAISCYKKVIEINPNYVQAHNNLGVSFKALGISNKAINCYEKAIDIDPNYVDAYNNLGVIYHILEENYKAKKYFEKAIKIDPSFTHAYWNLQSCSSNLDESLSVLQKLYKIDNTYINAKIMISALQGYKGNFDEFNSILASPHSQNPYARSVKWVFSLPKLPKLFFNRIDFFDAVIELTEKRRPFYEFGVWNGISFKHLIKTFKKGYGFDTFTGIPEAWHNEPKGNYSSFGAIPKIEGGEFIVGKFEDTLEDFFSKKRPIASLINFDADLYSSTLCALNNSDKVIDEKTILIFDEFIINDKWEEDEYKALNEFCNNRGYSYEVIAVSFATKQAAVKINKKIND
ncbi:tetratricopeptide repeat protein [Candidatus Pelagibacter sp. Uisw_104]|uniref:tetratricopeptide repeat protein n=1 Tax=Candidatus Pelagibacter sp. Uisw_104 TaxID=3230983 RepID=UPI0039EC8EA4